MAEDDHPAQPRSLTLMAGPDRLPHQPDRGQRRWPPASRSSGSRSNLISRVPLALPRRLRRVYPGFVQLTRLHEHEHGPAHAGLPATCTSTCAERRAREGRGHPRFYDEYFAVTDLPAEFYLETVEQVFQDYELAQGELKCARRHRRPRGHPPHRAAHGRRRARRHLLHRPDGGRARPVHAAPALHEDPPRAARRRPLRRVQRPALADTRSTRACAR